VILLVLNRTVMVDPGIRFYLLITGILLLVFHSEVVESYVKLLWLMGGNASDT